MKVNVKCFANLSDAETCTYKQSTSYQLDDGQTVADLIASAGIDGDQIKITFVNSRQAGLDTVLAHGDQVGFVPPVGGM